MKKLFGYVLMVGCLCFPASAQTTGVCESDLRHLKLPERAFIDEVFGLDQPHVAFLFSQDGVDVYSATDVRTMQAWQQAGMAFTNAITVILVYQDEQARQRKIQSLRKTLDSLPGWYRDAPLENLKFSTWRFELTPVWADNVLTRKWLIAGTAYFEPVSCEPIESRIPASSQGYLEASINCHNRIVGQMPPVPIPENQRLAPPDNSILAKALETMQRKLKTYGLPN
jgi:hypothetical protein